MQGYWVELSSSRARNDVKEFFPHNITLVKNPSTLELEKILSLARCNEAKVILECPTTYPGIDFGDETKR